MFIFHVRNPCFIFLFSASVNGICYTYILSNTEGPILSKGAVTKLEQMPKELFDLRNTESMDGNGYVSKQLHQAFHHYIKVMLCRAVLWCTVVWCGVVC